jgi:hypothetical protein
MDLTKLYTDRLMATMELSLSGFRCQKDRRTWVKADQRAVVDVSEEGARIRFLSPGQSA